MVIKKTRKRQKKAISFICVFLSEKNPIKFLIEFCKTSSQICAFLFLLVICKLIVAHVNNHRQFNAECPHAIAICQHQLTRSEQCSSLENCSINKCTLGSSVNMMIWEHFLLHYTLPSHSSFISSLVLWSPMCPVFITPDFPV